MYSFESIAWQILNDDWISTLKTRLVLFIEISCDDVPNHFRSVQSLRAMFWVSVASCSRNVRMPANLTIRVFREVSEQVVIAPPGLIGDGCSDVNTSGGIAGGGAVGFVSVEEPSTLRTILQLVPGVQRILFSKTRCPLSVRQSFFLETFPVPLTVDEHRHEENWSGKVSIAQPSIWRISFLKTIIFARPFVSNNLFSPTYLDFCLNSWVFQISLHFFWKNTTWVGMVGSEIEHTVWEHALFLEYHLTHWCLQQCQLRPAKRFRPSLKLCAQALPISAAASLQLFRIEFVL